MTDDRSKFDRLRAMRSQAQDARRQEHLRSTHGEELAAAIAKATGKNLSLASFDKNIQPPSPVDWPIDIRKASGLVAAYISKPTVILLLRCMYARLGPLSGMIGFHEKRYMGIAQIDRLELISLLDIADAVEDSVVFYNRSPNGVFLVDCYRSQPSEPYSVLVQGSELTYMVAACFGRQTD